MTTLRRAGCVWAEEEAALLHAAAASGPQLEALVARRVAGEPLEVLLGFVDFGGLRLAIGPGVFVPRRRTELLARTAAALVGAGDRVLDLCCGVGAVGAALAAARPGIELYAADIDPTATAWARRNLDDLGVATILTGDLYAPLPRELHGTFAVITANAPYVPSGEIAFMPVEARLHEPRHALDGGRDGTELHARIAAEAGEWLRADGALIIETGSEQSAITASILRTYGFATTTRTDVELEATVVVGRRGGDRRGGDRRGWDHRSWDQVGPSQV